MKKSILVFFLFITFVPVAWGIDGFSTIDYTINENETGKESIDNADFNQVYDLNVNKDITSMLRLRSSLRFTRFDQRTNTEGVKKRTTNEVLQPYLEVNFSGPKYNINSGYRRSETSIFNFGSSAVKNIDNNFFIRSFFNPFPNLPVSLQFEDNHSYDDLKPRERSAENTRLLTNVGYSIYQFTFNYNFNKQLNENKINGIVSNVDNNTINLSYNDTFLNEMFTISSSFVSNMTRSEQDVDIESSTAAQNVNIELLPVKGLKKNNDRTPKTGELENESFLIDNDFSEGVVDIGSGEKGEDTAIGVELFTPQTAKVLVIHMSNNFDSSLQSFFAFRIYVRESDNGDWSLVKFSRNPQYNQPERDFEIKIPGDVTAKYVKAVVVSNSTTEALVSEVQVLGPAGSGREKKIVSTSNVQTINANVSFSPLEYLTFGFNMDRTKSKNASPTRIQRNGTQTWRLAFNPNKYFDINSSFQQSFTKFERQDADDSGNSILTLSWGMTPLETLYTSVNYLINQSDTESEEVSRNKTINWNLEANIYRNLDFQLTYTNTRNKSFEEGTKNRVDTVSINLNSDLTDRLQGIFGYTWREAKSYGKDEPRLVFSNDAFLFFTYTLSGNFNLNARYNYQKSAEMNNFQQAYTIDWVIIPKLSAFMSYTRTNENSDITNTNNSENMIYELRWFVNRSIDIRLSYQLTRSLDNNEVTRYFVQGNVRF